MPIQPADQNGHPLKLGDVVACYHSQFWPPDLVASGIVARHWRATIVDFDGLYPVILPHDVAVQKYLEQHTSKHQPSSVFSYNSLRYVGPSMKGLFNEPYWENTHDQVQEGV